MNIRKSIDYSAMFTALDALMAKDLSQMELYCEIGRVVSDRPEKGAAVAAAEYLKRAYPDVPGFSPRNVRRMRDFYRTYKTSPSLLHAALRIGWTQNGVILEADLSLSEKEWYIQAVRRFGWSKLELLRQIEERAHEHMLLDNNDVSCYNKNKIAAFPTFDNQSFIAQQLRPLPHNLFWNAVFSIPPILSRCNIIVAISQIYMQIAICIGLNKAIYHVRC